MVGAEGQEKEVRKWGQPKIDRAGRTAGASEELQKTVKNIFRKTFRTMEQAEKLSRRRSVMLLKVDWAE